MIMEYNLKTEFQEIEPKITLPVQRPNDSTKSGGILHFCMAAYVKECFVLLFSDIDNSSSSSQVLSRIIGFS